MGADSVMNGSGGRVGIDPRGRRFCMPLPSSGGCPHSWPQRKTLEQLRRIKIHTATNLGSFLTRIDMAKSFPLVPPSCLVFFQSSLHWWPKKEPLHFGALRLLLSSFDTHTGARTRLRANSNDRKLLRCQGSNLVRCEVLVLLYVKCCMQLLIHGALWSAPSLADCDILAINSRLVEQQQYSEGT